MNEPQPCGDLCALARTCRDFHAPASRYLWYNLPDLSPLVMCMPSDLWGVNGATLVFHRGILPSDWLAFDAKASYVRIIGQNYDPLGLKFAFPRLCADHYYTLSVASYARSSSLLPSLRILYIPDPLHPLFKSIHMLASPTIERIYQQGLRNLKEPILFENMLGAIANRCRSITHADLKSSLYQGPYIRSNPRSLPYSLSSAVKNWHQLQVLKIEYLPLEAFQFLSTLPSLRRLDIWLEPFESTNHSFTGGLPAFPALTSLKLFSIQCVDVINTSSFPSLEVLEVRQQTSSVADWGAMHSAVREKCNTSALKEISIVEPIHNMSHGTSSIITLSALQPLLVFRELVSLSIGSLGVYDLDDTSMETIAKNLPCLEYFILRNVNIEPSGLPRTTLRSVQSFLQNCPELTAFGMKIDATIPFPQVPITTGNMAACFTNLKVYDSPIDNPSMVAEFLSSLMTCVQDPPEKLHIKSYKDSDCRELWNQVADLCEMIRNARDRERRLFELQLQQSGYADSAFEVASL